MSKRDELIGELCSCRHLLFSQLADLAEENGERTEALAWRWLRDHNKWPLRKRVYDNYRWGWTFMRNKLGLINVAKMLPSVLPFEFKGKLKEQGKEIFDTEEEAIKAVVPLLAGCWYIRK